MAKPVKSGVKRPYSTPRFTVYGTLRELTQSHSPLGNPDNSNRRNQTYTRTG